MLEYLGGPHSVYVEDNFGMDGINGTSFFFSNGDPNVPGNLDMLFSVGLPIEYDIAINVDPSDIDEYLYMYQYLKIQGTDSLSWQKTLRLTPNVFPFRQSAIFIQSPHPLIGYTQLNPINIFVAPEIAMYLASLTQAERNNAFILQSNINFEVYNDKPINANIANGDVSVNLSTNVVTIPLSISAMEYSGTAWQSVVGSRDVGIFIGLVST